MNDKRIEEIIDYYSDYQMNEEYKAFSARTLRAIVKQCISEAIAEHEAKQNVIKVKALRKNGTDNWYRFVKSKKKWEEKSTPDTFESRISEGNIVMMPPDAELVNIEIKIKEDVCKHELRRNYRYDNVIECKKCGERLQEGGEG